MTKELDAILHFIFLATAIICWITNKKREDLTYMKYVGAFLFVTFIFDSIAAVIMFRKLFPTIFNSNLFIYHFLVPLQFFLTISIYLRVLRTALYKRIGKLCIPFFICISLLISFTIQPFATNNSISIILKHFITIVFVLLFFFELLSVPSYYVISKQPIFWISIAFLFHASFNILIEGVSNVLVTYGDNENRIIYYLYSISNYILFILLSIGFLFYDKSLSNYVDQRR